MDQEIAELKREVESLKAVTVDTNKIVHGMRRSQRWHSFFTVLWWIIILGLTGASYYFIQPYISQATAAYGNAKDFQVQVQDFFARFGRTGAQ